jgi:hypothetical protein
MKRRTFVSALLATAPVARLAPWRVATPSDLLLIPMDDSQGQHLKAYGVTFRQLERGGKSEWLLNYRGGSFLLPADAATVRDAALQGVTAIPISVAESDRIRAEVAESNSDAVPLEKAPKMAVYVTPNAAPWDDAVTMALNHAGIAFDKIWDAEVMADRLTTYDWLHLHHEDFTGQFSKFYLSYSGAPWLREMVDLNTQMARRLGFPHVPAAKRAVAGKIREFVDGGGFLFAMCTATETLDLALAAHATDIAASFADNTPMDPGANGRLDWSRSLAFTGAALEASPTVPQFSDIDGHLVNSPGRRQPLGSFTLFEYSAKIDPVNTMLVQNHRQVIPDFYGLTTSFLKERIKPGVTVLADEPGAPWAKYIHGELGRGTWTFYGGHDPEDPQHAIGDAPTDLSLHPSSPGYRLILNNVLFPAAKKKELKT